MNLPPLPADLDGYEGLRKLAIYYGGECYGAATDRAAKIAQHWTHPDTLRLHAGEMTAQELRTVVAVLNVVIAAIRSETR